MRVFAAVSLLCGALLSSLPGYAQDDMVEQILRTRVFNRAFEGFAYYSVMIEEDRLQADGSREVTAVASGRFLENTKHVKVLVLMVDEQIIGSQVLQEQSLPPCLASEQGPSSSL